MPDGHLEQMQSFWGPRVLPKALQPSPCSGGVLAPTWCSSVSLAVVWEALVHPFLLGCPMREAELGTKGCLSGSPSLLGVQWFSTQHLCLLLGEAECPFPWKLGEQWDGRSREDVQSSTAGAWGAPDRIFCELGIQKALVLGKLSCHLISRQVDETLAGNSLLIYTCKHLPVWGM